MTSEITRRINEDTGVSLQRINATIRLIEEGATIPFIARYRKEATGNLDEVRLRQIAERYLRYGKVAERRAGILAEIAAHERLTPEVREQIEQCEVPEELEDLYLAFRPKRQSKASLARRRGLEELADYILSQSGPAPAEEVALRYISFPKRVPDTASAIEGALHIVAERMSEGAGYRKWLRNLMLNEGTVQVKAVKDKQEQKTKYSMYYDFSEAVTTIPSHRILAIRRGTREKVLSHSIQIDDAKAFAELKARNPIHPLLPSADLLERALTDSYERLLKPVIQNEVRNILRLRAEHEAITVFEDNLSALLLAPPAGEITVIGIEPNLKGGSRLAVVGPDGSLVEHRILRLTPPKTRSNAGGPSPEAKLGSADRAIAVAKPDGSPFGRGPNEGVPPAAARMTTSRATAQLLFAGSVVTGPEGNDLALEPPSGAAGPDAADSSPHESARDTAVELSPLPEPDAGREAPAPPDSPAPEYGASRAASGAPTAESEPAGSPDTPDTARTATDAPSLQPHTTPETPAEPDSPRFGLQHAPVSTSPGEPPAQAETAVPAGPQAPETGNGATEPVHAEAPGYSPEAGAQTPISTTEPTSSSPIAPASHALSAAPPPEIRDQVSPAPEPAPSAGSGENPGIPPGVEIPTPEQAIGGSLAPGAPEAGAGSAPPLPWASEPPATATAGSNRTPLEDPGNDTTRAGDLGPPPEGVATRQADTASHPERAPEPEAALVDIIKRSGAGGIVIGNGNGSRQAEAFVRSVIAKNGLDVFVIVTNEAGAGVYAASKPARQEFPNVDSATRSAVSIARRLQDPLAELVKIDPKSIGVGQYQHDVDQQKLKASLWAVVESAVNRVGVDLNDASRDMLRYVSGLSDELADTILEYRRKAGPFSTREQLRQIDGIDERAFTQAAGFLRVRNGPQPLDRTFIHPESYPIVEKLAESIGTTVDDVFGNTERLRAIPFAEFEGAVGRPTLRDIRQELLHPGRDLRKRFVIPCFRDDVRDISDLKEGMELEGTVTNVTNFGAFVDIGVHQDGLVHISELSHRYVADARQAAQVGDVVKVKVIGVDAAQTRISLSVKATVPKPKPQPESRHPKVAAEAGADPPRHSRPRESAAPTRKKPRRARSAGRSAAPPLATRQLSMEEKIRLLQEKFKSPGN